MKHKANLKCSRENNKNISLLQWKYHMSSSNKQNGIKCIFVSISGMCSFFLLIKPLFFLSLNFSMGNRACTAILLIYWQGSLRYIKTDQQVNNRDLKDVVV